MTTSITPFAHLARVYDLLIAEHQLGEATRFVDRHPQQIFVLDHIAKPKIAAGEIEPWRTRIHELSRRSTTWRHVSCFDRAVRIPRPVRGTIWPVYTLSATVRKSVGRRSSRLMG